MSAAADKLFIFTHYFLYFLSLSQHIYKYFPVANTRSACCIVIMFFLNMLAGKSSCFSSLLVQLYMCVYKNVCVCVYKYVCVYNILVNYI